MFNKLAVYTVLFYCPSNMKCKENTYTSKHSKYIDARIMNNLINKL